MFKSIQKLTLSVAVCAVFAGPAMANDMVNNQASGYVDGDIIQEAFYGNADINLEVGSVSGAYTKNNKAQGDISGTVLQRAYGEYNSIDARVGSISADFAKNNEAEGFVNGDVVQDAYGSNTEIDLEVGSVGESGNNWGFVSAENNKAQGFVDGDVYQTAGSNSRLNARIGSVGSRR